MPALLERLANGASLKPAAKDVFHHASLMTDTFLKLARALDEMLNARIPSQVVKPLSSAIENAKLWLPSSPITNLLLVSPAVVAGTMTTAMEAFVQTCEEAHAGAIADKNQGVDDAFSKCYEQLGAICGGAANGKSWCSDFTGPVDSLVSHFQKTLDKVNTQQIVDKHFQMAEARETYVCSRAPGRDMDRHLENAASYAERARVTQLECVIMRTVLKSRKPAVRLESIIAAFNTEDDLMSGKRIPAREALAGPVLDFLNATYTLASLRTE